MLGQVTVYTTTGCPYCLQAKQTLREQGIDFTDVSVDKYSKEVREWLKVCTVIYFLYIHFSFISNLI